MKDSYVVITDENECKVCRKKLDLRCGVCFQCSSQIDGMKIREGFKLWDVKNPSNSWVYYE